MVILKRLLAALVTFQAGTDCLASHTQDGHFLRKPTIFSAIYAAASGGM
jgi:hypothetical protein